MWKKYPLFCFYINLKRLKFRNKTGQKKNVKCAG